MSAWGGSGESAGMELDSIREGEDFERDIKMWREDRR